MPGRLILLHPYCFSLLLFTEISLLEKQYCRDVICTYLITLVCILFALPSLLHPSICFLILVNKEVEESNVYNYPEIDLDNITIEAEQNEVYATNTDILLQKGIRHMPQTLI